MMNLAAAYGKLEKKTGKYEPSYERCREAWKKFPKGEFSTQAYAQMHNISRRGAYHRLSKLVCVSRLGVRNFGNRGRGTMWKVKE